MRPAMLALLVTAAAVTAWTCAVATAAHAPTEATHTQTATANDQTLVEAKCPSGKHPVSGGFELEPGDETFAVNSAEGIDLPRKRWSLTTIAVGGSARATAAAYCSKLGRHVEFRSDRTELSQGDAATITATCKRDERVLSGGYAFVSSGLALGEVGESFRADPRSWSIEGMNFSDTQVTLIAFAHCVPKQKAPKLTTAQTSVPFSDEGPTSATATCEQGRYALSGGFQGGDEAQASFVESGRAGTGAWEITEAGGISGRDDDMTALAYCAKK